MAITPLIVGTTHTKISSTWTDDTGAAIDLTGATITLVFNNGASDRTGTGTTAFIASTAGTFTYTFSVADAATAANYTCQFKAVFGDSTVLFSDPFALVMQAQT